jgi:hypothetical protein
MTLLLSSRIVSPLFAPKQKIENLFITLKVVVEGAKWPFQGILL